MDDKIIGLASLFHRGEFTPFDKGGCKGDFLTYSSGRNLKKLLTLIGPYISLFL